MKTITTPKGKVLVDESAEIKEDTYVFTKDRGIERVSKPSIDFLHFRFCKKHGTKIIASINFSLHKDLPMVMVEYEADKLSKVKYPTIHNSEFKSDATANIITKLCRSAFIEGRKGLYSEEVIELAIEFGLQYAFDQKMTKQYQKDKLKFIQSLNQEPIELETECEEPRECSCDSNGDCLMPVIKTTRVDGQLMAYLKQANPA